MSEFDGINPYEAEAKEKIEAEEQQAVEEQQISNDEKSAKDRAFFCIVFARVLQSPNIYRRFILKKKNEFITLKSLTADEPIVIQAANEFYDNFMPSILKSFSFLGKFQFLEEIYEKYYKKYQGMIDLTIMISISCNSELKEWEKQEEIAAKEEQKSVEKESQNTFENEEVNA